MTAYIREQALLTPEEIDAIERLAPGELVAWRDAVGGQRPRRQMREWLDVFDASDGMLHAEGIRDLYAHVNDSTTHAA